MSTDKPTTTIVNGMAHTQKSHCEWLKFRMSKVFMPKTEATKDNGRNTIVTVVKTRIAAS